MTIFCQVIKANNKACSNYARKGKNCCYSHRNLENVQTVQEIVQEIVQEMVSSVDLRAQSLDRNSPEPSTSESEIICYFTGCKLHAGNCVISRNKLKKYACWRHT